MTKNEIKEASRNGSSNFEILEMVVSNGYDFADAVSRVAEALRMAPDEVEDMIRDYDECC